MMTLNDRKLLITTLLVICFGFLVLVASMAGAADWYVRPFTYPIQYGSANGTSYDTAWNGFPAVVWGASGVTSGDTLWVCGQHDQNYPYGMLSVSASGTSTNHITIRGDCTTKNSGYSNGTIWLVHTKYPKGYAWKGPDVFGVYSSTQYGQSNSLPAIEDQTVVLNNMGKIPDASWTAGSYYHDVPATTFYYKPTIGTANTHLVYSSAYVASLRIANQDYIDVKNLTWNMGGATAIYMAGDNYVTLDNLNIQFARYGVQVNNDGTTAFASKNCSLTNSTLHEAGAGIYFTTAAGVTDVSIYWTISGNTIYNINRPDIWDPDRHAIGVQGARYFMISNNIIHDIGGPSPASDKRAIDLYNRGPGMYVDNNVVTRNLIYNALYGGIVLESNNACDPETMKNNVFSYNIVWNCPAGSGISWKSFKAADGSPSLKIYNNTVYNCANSYNITEYSGADANYYTSFDFRNNISLSPITRHFYYYTGATNKDWSYVTMNNNIYYPDGTKFKWNFTDSLTFAQFKALMTNVVGADANSLDTDPLLTNFIPPPANSPAVNNGANLGAPFNIDYAGNKQGRYLSTGSGWDIGAYMYQRFNLRIVK